MFAAAAEISTVGRGIVNWDLSQKSQLRDIIFWKVFFLSLAAGVELGGMTYTNQISSMSFIIWSQVVFLVNHPFKSALEA